MDNPLFGAPAVNRIYGVVIGIVTNNVDPEGQYRVKVKFPWISSGESGEFESNWARIATFMAGKKRGAFWLPEVGDEVLIAFEHGDLRRPIVIGSLWSPVDEPIHDNNAEGGENNWRSIRSRSGNVIQFYDKPGEERIVIQTTCAEDTCKDGTKPEGRKGHYIVLDQKSGKEKIEIYDTKKENYVLIESDKNQITIKSANGNILLEAPNGEIKLKSKTLVTETTSTTTQKAQGAFKQETQATMDIKSASAMTIKGSVVKIN